MIQNHRRIIPCLAHIISHKFIKASIMCGEKIMVFFSLFESIQFDFQIGVG